MLDDASLSAAAAAGTAVAEAATVERWTVVRDRVARFLARGDLRAEQEHRHRLDLSAAALREADGPEPRIRVETALQTRFELLLEQAAAGERSELTRQLGELARLGLVAHATVAAPVTGGALALDGGPDASVTLVGQIPAPAEHFRDRGDALGSPAPVRVLTGPAGTGKTQQAAHLARRALRDGSADLVVWVTATSGDALVCGYADAAAVTTDHDPGRPEHSAEAFRSWLSWTDRRWLVVLDGVPDTAGLDGMWPPSRPHGRVLVTARRATSLPDGAECVGFGPYPAGVAADQLTRELLGHGHRDDPADVAALAADLRWHPAALSTAAACVARAGPTCAAHRERLARRTRAEVTDVSGADGAGAASRDAVTAGWWLAVGAADRECAGLARPLLELAAVLDPHGVPVEVLTSEPALDHLARRSASGDAGTPPGTRDVLDALGVLHGLRLVEYDGDAECPAVRLSTLVQEAVREAVPEEDRDALALSAADALRAVWRTASERPRSALCRALRSGTDALTGHAREALWRPHCHAVLFQTGRNLIDAGLVRAARIRWDWLHAKLEQRFGPDHPDTLAARGYQARVRGASRDAAGAVAAYRDLLGDLERVLGPDNPDVFTVRDNLARWQGVAGDPARAAAAYTDLLADRLPVLGPTHPDTLLTRHNIALWRGRAGDAAGAAAAYAALLDDMVRVFDGNHPAVVETRDQLTEWRNRAADVAAAVPATVRPRPETTVAGPWSVPDSGPVSGSPVPPPGGAALSARSLLLEPPWSARLLRRLTRRRGPGRGASRPVAEPGRPIVGCHRVSVISLKGGTGKTTTAAALGATLAGLCADPVIAVDASPEGGTLGHRVRRRNGATVLDLLAALPEADSRDAVRRFTSTGPGGLEVLAHDVGPALSCPFGAQQYQRVVDALSRVYPVVVTDSGTGLMQEAMRGVLALTDQLVVVATASVDGAAVADVTLDWLAHHGHAELARRALVVLSAVHPGTTPVRTDRIVEHFAGRCRGVVTVPFDDHLATGAELDMARLRSGTRRAYDELAALVIEGFHGSAGRGEAEGGPAESSSAVPGVPGGVPGVPGIAGAPGEGAGRSEAAPGQPGAVTGPAGGVPESAGGGTRQFGAVAGKYDVVSGTSDTVTGPPGTVTGQSGTVTGPPGEVPGQPPAVTQQPGTVAQPPGTVAEPPAEAPGRPHATTQQPGRATAPPGTATRPPGTATAAPGAVPGQPPVTTRPSSTASAPPGPVPHPSAAAPGQPPMATHSPGLAAEPPRAVTESTGLDSAAPGAVADPPTPRTGPALYGPPAEPFGSSVASATSGTGAGPIGRPASRPHPGAATWPASPPRPGAAPWPSYSGPASPGHPEPAPPAAIAGPDPSAGPGDHVPPAEHPSPDPGASVPPAAPPPPPGPGTPEPPPAPSPSAGSARAARPARRARLTVEDDVVRVGAATTIGFTLAAVDPRDAELDRTAPVSVLVIGTSRSSATLEPSALTCATDDAEPARFTFTAREPGEHRLRFRVYDPEYGKVLQVVEATLPVAVPEPLGRP
ncbi:hypothetical protein [Streptomyces sp. NPDC004783]|uniref:nucleotide-binding protein n=1 Tax=Streptomyces sp. NPDC004783 TaxID=3154459 RepID=UPI0033BDE8FD